MRSIVFVFLFIFILSIPHLTSSQFLALLDQQEMIVLYKALSLNTTRHGITEVHKTYFIKTYGEGEKISVFVHQELSDGNFEDIPAILNETISRPEEKFQLWKAEVHWTSLGTQYNYGKKFALKLIVNSGVFWDNNEGNNYSLDTNSGPMLGRKLHVCLNYAILEYYHSDDKTRFYGAITVKNIAFYKIVYLRLTTNSWKTSQRVDAAYSPTFSYPGSEAISSPNGNGVESWNFFTEIGDGQIEKVEFVIAFQVKGETYWDNNNWKNYFVAINSPIIDS